MTIICSTPVGDEKNFAKTLDLLKGYNLPCQVKDGVLETRFTGSKAKAFEIISLFESLAECNILITSQRVWQEDKT